MPADPAAQRGPRLGPAGAAGLQRLRRRAAQIGLRGGEDAVQHLLPFLEAAPPAARATQGSRGIPPAPGGRRGGRRGVRSAALRAPRARAPAALALAHTQLQVLPQPGLKRGRRRRRRLGRARRGRPGLHPPPRAPPLPSSSSFFSALSGCASSRSPAAAAADAAAPAGSDRRLRASAGASRPRRRGSPAAGLRRRRRRLLAHRRGWAVAAARSPPLQSLWFRAQGLQATGLPPPLAPRPRPGPLSSLAPDLGSKARSAVRSQPPRQGTPQPTPSGQHLSAAGAAASERGARATRATGSPRHARDRPPAPGWEGERGESRLELVRDPSQLAPREPATVSYPRS